MGGYWFHTVIFSWRRNLMNSARRRSEGLLLAVAVPMSMLNPVWIRGVNEDFLSNWDRLGEIGGDWGEAGYSGNRRREAGCLLSCPMLTSAGSLSSGCVFTYAPPHPPKISVHTPCLSPNTPPRACEGGVRGFCWQ